MKHWQPREIALLAELRARFIEGRAGEADYWRSDEELALYDQTFAARIGWKIDAALRALGAIGWQSGSRRVLDWGCGTGIATRRILAAWPGFTSAAFHDRSARAMAFARESVALAAGESRADRDTLLVISHVLNELSGSALDELLAQVRAAGEVIWIEAGTHADSRRLIAVRELLLAESDPPRVVAPCMHQSRCGLLAPENARHWCHHFATPPPGVFTDGNWSKFANLMGIDLRDLPLSFLALDQRAAAPLPTHATRVLGHPRIYKPHALLLSCNASGVSEQKLTKRSLPDEFRQLRKGAFDRLQLMQSVDKVVAATKPLFANEPGPSQPD